MHKIFLSLKRMIKLNAFTYFIIYIILLFFFVNMLKYEEGNFYFSISNLSFGIHKEKFNLYISFLTFGGIIIAIAQWMYNISIRRKTDLNGLLEEIHHNFNISGNLFLTYKNEGVFFAKIYHLLEKQKELV